MIEAAEEKGLITPGVTTLLEVTSGNTGIALAAIAAQRGYKFIALIPANYSLERRIIMKSLGADIYLLGMLFIWVHRCFVSSLFCRLIKY